MFATLSEATPSAPAHPDFVDFWWVRIHLHACAIVAIHLHACATVRCWANKVSPVGLFIRRCVAGAKPEQKGVSEEELLGLNGFPVPLAMDHTALQHSFQPER
eukprot:1137075-Pelagomonas_calceolata.AAC.1